MSIGRLVALSLTFAVGAFAAPQLTTIQDTLYMANGAPMSGTAVITWYSFQASDTSSIGMQSLSVPIVNGSIYVQLVPNTTANPSEPYTVTYSSSGYMTYTETWMVPPSSSPLTVSAVRISSTTSSTPPGSGSDTGGTGGATGPFPESAITGLSSDLSARPQKGPAFGIGRVALVDQNGAIDTVVGNVTDCVYVNGTSGPCFDPTQLPGYSDSENPSGVVDGSNTTFGLAGQPSPALSLILFRNGLVQKPNLDYSISGSTLQFVAANAPQPGDTLMAWYRKAPSASGPQGGGLTQAPVFVNATTPQVICSNNGTQTTGASTTMGTCTLPANLLSPGDRIDIRFLYSHTGTALPFNFAVLWGATTVIQRTGGTSDALVSGRMDASITSGNTEFAGESFGSVLGFSPTLGAAPASPTTPLTIAFKGGFTTPGADAVGLVSYTVIRYPAVTNP